MGAGFSGGDLCAFGRSWTLRRWQAELAAILLLCPILLHAALWNGFPLLFYDTGAYIVQGFGRVFIPERSPIYSFFLAAAGGWFSLWLVAIVQCLIAAFVIVSFTRALRPGTTLWTMLGIGLFLSLFTGLAWAVGEMEPDFLAPIAALSLYLLAFHLRRLGHWRALLLIVIGGFAIASHPSHFGLGGGLVLVLAGLKLARRRWPLLPRPNVLAPASGFLLGLLAVVSVNFVMTGQVFVSRSGAIFLGARLIGDNIAQPTLAEICQQHPMDLCEAQHFHGTADHYLWGPNSPFSKIGGFNANQEDYSLMIREGVKRYPLTLLGHAGFDTLRQFLMVRTGDGIEPCRWVLQSGFAQFIPWQLKGYLDARQQNGLIRFAPINVVHVPLAFGALIWLVAALWSAVRRRRWDRASLHAYILIALLGNAMVCGFFSGPHDRYQSRIVWIVPFALLLTEAGSVWRGLSLRRESS